MARRYDLESLLRDVETILKDELNAKITAINTEKADDLSIDPIDAGAYFVQTLNDRAANCDPFVLLGVEDLQAEGTGPDTIEKPKISIVIVKADDGQDMNITYRMLRYQRALRETIEEHWSGNTDGAKLQVSSLVPVQFAMFNTDDNYRAIGVLIDAAIG